MRAAARPLLLSMLLAALAAAAALPAHAQAPDPAADAPLRVLEDASNDEGFSVAGQPTGQSRWAATDLLSLDVHEGARGLEFVLGVRALGTETTPVVDIVLYTVSFLALDVPYRASLTYDGETGSVSARLCSPGEGGFYRCFESLPIAADAATATFAFAVPLDLLVASGGAPLGRGDAVTGWEATAESTGALVVDAYSMGQVRATDRMPEDGPSAAAWIVRSGVEQVGHIVLSSKSPVRVSNGEATTFLFRVAVRNTLDRADTVALAAHGVLDTWVATFPSEVVRLDAGETQEVPVLITVPFGHRHGEFHKFTVTGASRSDPLAVGQVELGVRYTRVPQPAGHHDTLYLHEQGGSFYVNTLEEEEIPADEDTGGQTSGGCSFSGGAASGSSQIVALVPGLELGLDFAMERTGLARLTLQSDTPVMGGSSVGGYVVTWPRDEYPDTCASEAPEGAVAEIVRSPPLTMEADTPHTVEVAIKPLPAGDRIDYDPGLQMGILLIVYNEESGSLPVCCFDVGSPGFMAGSTFQLPLDEYHDPVDEYFATLSGVELFAAAAQQKPVNPGETVVFQLTAGNLGASASFDLELTGLHTEWARILGDQRITLDAGAQRDLAVAVSVPADAVPGETVDVTLHAVKSDDANVRSLIRFLATVDTSTDHPDEAGDVEGLDDSLTGKDAPLPAWLAAAGLAAARALRRRR